MISVGEASPSLQPRHAVASATPSPKGAAPKTLMKIGKAIVGMELDLIMGMSRVGGVAK